MEEMNPMAQVRVEVETGKAKSNRPARVLVYNNNQLVVEVVAELDGKQRVDGGRDLFVTLKKIDHTPKDWLSAEAFAD